MAPHRIFRQIPREKRRILLLFFLLMLLAVLAAASLLAEQPQEAAPVTPSSTTVTLYEYGYADLASVTIRRGDEAPWTAVPEDEISVTILGDDGFTLAWEEGIDFLLSAVCISADAVLTEDPADYRDHLADYGLENPRYEARIVYKDGTDITLRVGDKGHDGTWRYMLISGDDRLFAYSIGAVESLFVNRDTLRKVTQPVLHKARMDRITLTQGEQVTQWTLRGDIADTDAADKWFITAPIAYPADADAMATTLANAAQLRLGAYIAPATPENLTLYGFNEPRLTIEIHMAAGTIAVNNAEGAAEATDYPESTVTFVVGGEKTDLVDYILCGESIYISSHFTMGVFMDVDITASMSRYPVLTALGNLASLSIRTADETAEYALTRTEQVAPNNELITDEDGNPVYTTSVTCNGSPVDYAAFETAYNALSLVTVSGTLPTETVLRDDPHTVYTFTDVDGTTHTVALTTFDVLHDAVIVDGHAAFYLIKDGFRLNMD